MAEKCCYLFFQVFFLEIARFVHVADDTLDGNVADCFAEKELFDCGGGDGSKCWQQKEKTTEAQLLTWIGSRDVTAECQLGLVLQIDSRWNIAKSGSY
jgi:hypothetical protein